MPKSKVKTVYYIVYGTSYFPVDMLRYDFSYPMSELDSSLMKEKEFRHIALATDSRHSPTVERWASFGWVVTDVSKDPYKIEKIRGRGLAK